MGLTLHYSCSIKQASCLPELVEEVKDICKEMNWSYHIWNEDKLQEYSTDIHKKEWAPDDLYGISFSAPECEPFSLTFLPNGKLSAYINLLAAPYYDEYDWIYFVAIKTQFAGADVHICLVKLLKYLEKKYLKDVSVTDEGNYWETDSKEVLLERFSAYNHLLKVVEKTLRDFKTIPGETTGQFADRLEQYLKNKLTGNI